MDIIKQTLEKQLQLLFKRCEKIDSLNDLLQINRAICNIAHFALFLEHQITYYKAPENRNSFSADDISKNSGVIGNVVNSTINIYNISDVSGNSNNFIVTGASEHRRIDV